MLDPAVADQYFLGDRLTSDLVISANAILILTGRTINSSGSHFWSWSIGYFSGGSFTNLSVSPNGNGVVGFTAGTLKTTTHSGATIPSGAQLAMRVLVGAGTPQASHISVYYPPS